MSVFRSFVYTLYFAGWSVIFSVSFLPVLAYAKIQHKPKLVQKLARLWVGGLTGGFRLIVGVKLVIEGQENIPHGAAIVAPKHQSNFETLLFHSILPDPIYILKKELGDLPVVGWYLKGAGMIPVDRKGGSKAAKDMVEKARAALSEESQIIIFPEGTRVQPGQKMPYQPGVAILYAMAHVPVVPVALNSGLCWPRNGFLTKKSGTITVSFLEPIPPGMKQREFLKLLEERVERRSNELLPLDIRPQNEPGTIAEV